MRSLSLRRSVGLFSVLTLGLAASASAQSFSTHAEQQARFETLARTHADATLLNIGASAGDRALYGLAIGQAGTDHPALLVLGGVEPYDVTSPHAAEAFAEYLLTTDADSVQALLARSTVYVIPRLSPDPLAGYHATPRHQPHGNAHPDDADRDGLIDEDGADDLNDDGIIAMMRVLASDGTMIADDADGAMMRMADMKAGEVGLYHVLIEGRDNDGDLHVNEDAVGGIRINRNTTHSYAPYTAEVGQHPFEAPELRALGDFVFAHPNIAAVFSFGDHDNLHTPWKIRHPQRRTRPNQFAADSVAHAALTKALAPLAAYRGVGSVPSGSIPGWAYYHAGRLSFGAPAFTYPTDDEVTQIRSEHDRMHAALRWLRANRPELVHNWTAIDHPDYPGQTVEIGGAEPFATQNPMADSLLAQATEATTPLLFSLAHHLPQLEMDAARVTDLGGNTYRVTLTVHNAGMMPTHTQAGRAVRAQRPVRIDATLANGQQFVNGRAITLLSQPIPGMSRQDVTFVIQGRGTVAFEAFTPSAGRATTTVALD
ncbi:MAG: M14 family zinc carboxypeptidase, partial [Bacteroidota bacterium]